MAYCFAFPGVFFLRSYDKQYLRDYHWLKLGRGVKHSSDYLLIERGLLNGYETHPDPAPEPEA